jgi:demethylmenaquinone methyltransferase / 2-methoxy-6-polyprenyl-1,4-benzoquinol methylase
MDTPSRVEIWKMFDQISPTYDTVNRVMTSGLDVYWRRKVAESLPKERSLRVLDLATGTADQILAIMKCRSEVTEAIGIDLAKDMLQIGKKKVEKTAFASKISLIEADALDIPFADETFDVVTMSFGIRNVTDVDRCLKEIFRVLKKGGCAWILEGTLPTGTIVRPMALFYLRHLLPRIGALISKNSQAYRYLNRTIETFPSGELFCSIMSTAGFQRSEPHSLTFGLATLYEGHKS